MAGMVQRHSKGFARRCLQNQIRASGNVTTTRYTENQAWTVGRLGGDEFAILVAGSDPKQIGPDARNFADKLASLLRNNEKARGFQGISVGVASAPMAYEAGLAGQVSHAVATSPLTAFLDEL